MRPPLETVVKQLEDSGLVAPRQLEPFVPPKAHPKDAETLLLELCRQHVLTKFQAQQVAMGRVKSLSLGAYTILDKIGAGGMGQVFKARHRKMERVVAIKMLPPTMTNDAAALARFQREVVAAARLRHPNIVAADDAAEAHGVHFLVMEYVNGPDLSALVKKAGPLPVGKAVDYILQAARGLQFAHGEGVVHRDIKPANLLLDRKGVIKILDMGLARIEVAGDAPTQAELTAAGAVMGTVDYMAPEQALGTHHADARADIYSLGISLYYLLAGKAPYGGDTLMARLLAHRQQPIPSLPDVQAGVPNSLQAIFQEMVAKEVEDRYQSMSQVVEALENFRVRVGAGAHRSATTDPGQAATVWTLSDEERRTLETKPATAPLRSQTKAATSEKTKGLLFKIMGGTFATIIAPILVTYLIKYLEPSDAPPKQTGDPAPAANAPPVTKTVPLFDGKTLNGWHGDSSLWSVQDGAIVGHHGIPLKKTSFLVSDTKYQNFILRLKFRLHYGNSGVQIRSVEKPDGLVAGPQADIAYEDFKWLGSLTGEGMSPGGMLAATSEDTKRVLRETVDQAGWNDMTVTVNGDTISVQLNGQTTVELTSSRIPREAGVIALQLHRGNATTVRFKAIRLEPLP